MGYNILIIKTNFRIVAGNTDSVLLILKNLATRKQDFAFVKNNLVIDSNDISSAFEARRWLLEIDDEGNIVDLDFVGEKLGDEQILFDAIAPFVETGSYIIVAGENGESGKVWRWRFDGKHCNYKVGKIIF